MMENVVTRKHGGMPAWALLGVTLKDRKPVFYWPYTSDVDGERFLTRFIVFRTNLLSMDITRIHSADDKRMYPHDHSRSFTSFKFGSYDEWAYNDPNDLANRTFRQHRRFSCHILRHTQAHTITRVSPKLVTIMFLGPKKQKSNYWTPLGKRSIGMKVDQT
jgi:hypothetical protein